MFLLTVNLLCVMAYANGADIWINYPEQCKNISLKEGLKELCGGNQLMNIRNKLLDDTYKEIGEICTPNYAMEKRSQGYRCASIKKKVICKMLDNFDHEVTYISESHPIDKSKCHELIQHRDLLNNKEEPYYPPPKCDSSSSSVNELEFITLINYNAMFDPIGFESNDNYLFNFEGSDKKPIDHIYQSEFCQSKNWICHGDKSYIPLEIFKGDNQVSIRLELIKLGIIYDSNFGELPINNACLLNYCGKSAIKLFNGAIIRIKNSPLTSKLTACNKSQIDMPEVNLARKRYSNIGPVLLTTINKRYDICQKIKKNLELERPVPINNLHYLAPFEPGQHPALVYRQVSTTISSSFRSKVVPVNMLSMSMCEYTTGILTNDGIVDDLKSNDTVIKLINNKEIKWSDIKNREHWYEEQRNPDIIDGNETDLLSYWYNGVTRKGNTIIYPTSYILQTLKKVYMDTEKELKVDFFRVEHEYNVTRKDILKHNYTNADRKNDTNLDKEYLDREYKDIKELNATETKKEGEDEEVQIIQNKEYWNEESSIWGISTIITIIGIYYIYRKNKRSKTFLNVKHKITKFFKLDY
ncbi:non-structural transmembrane glycoprotein GNS [Berrimah virus]|uniref:Non-structural transmembrane glycoprotein GNS n=1 Tax=Berrimah virus TaxID=318834 RepID=I3NUX8_9RHAB|nr:non-structural transmembrane glycoprotein GNS [Berrimah virus]AEH58020.1 non-structural transmembrane glycoprotein GNS [Berrimah virus]